MSSLLQIATRKTLPLDFGLLNEQDLNALYITDDPEGQTLRLELVNSAGELLQLLAPPQEGQPAYHFELVFRPGVLSDALLDKLSIQENTVALNKVKNEDGTVSLRMQVPPRSLEKGEKITITLLHVSPDGRLGSRGTRVMLRYFNVQVHGTDTVISGFRETHLSLVTHLGKQNIPLHVGFVGSAQVLNNGSTNTLILRISNLSKKYAILPSDNPLKPSFFYLSFEVGDHNEEWALGKDTEVKGIWVQYQAGHKNDDLWVDGKKIGGGTEWQIPVPPLPPEDFLDIKLDKIITSHPSGNTQVSIRYENIPGYWDNHYVAIIEKSPMVFRGNRAGIGIIPTTGTLHVFNPVQIPIATESSSEIGTWFRMNNTSAGGRPWNIISTGVKNGEGSGNLLFKQDDGGPIRLMLTAQGNVGIETTKPVDRLQIGDYYNGADTYLSVKTVGGNKFKAGLRFRHHSEDFGYSIVSDETVNGLQVIGRHGPATENVTILDIRGWAEYSVDIKAVRLQVSGGKNATELVLEADTDNTGNERPMLTMKRHGGTSVGQLGFPDAGNKDFLLINQVTQTAVRLSENGSAYLCSANTNLVVQKDGNVVVYQGGQAKWHSNTMISDIRLKTDIQPIQRPLERLASLQGISFHWKEESMGKERELGLIAQEVEQVFPELMQTLGIDAKLVQYEKFVPVLIEALKEQQQMIKELKEKVDLLSIHLK